MDLYNRKIVDWSMSERVTVKSITIPAYRAATKEEAEQKLDELDSRWGKKYHIVLKSWRHNLEELSNYFKYPEDIRKIIYTTNTIEGFHRQIRKVTKTKSAFPSDAALGKVVILGCAANQWEMNRPDTKQAVNAFTDGDTF